MKKYILDSSVIIKWFNVFNEKDIDKADLILKYAQEEKIELITSELAKYEIGNALLIKKKLPLNQFKKIDHTLEQIPLIFYKETEKSATLSYKFSQKYKITYYDGVFLSLAKIFKATLITENFKHQGKVKEVEVIRLKDFK